MLTSIRASTVVGGRPNVPHRQWKSQQPRVVSLAQKEPPTQEPSSGEDKLDRMIEQLKKTGMTSGKAKQVLKTWQNIGLKDAKQLRTLLVSNTLAPIPPLALQALFDTAAGFGGFYIADLASKSDIPFRIGVELLGNFAGLYYVIQVLAELGVIAGLLYTSVRYGTNSTQLLAAVQSLAGPTTGVSVVDQAQRAVNVFKVLAVLESVQELLAEEFKDGSPKGDSLRNLGAYLTLSHAKETQGFNPADFGLTDKEAGNIAYAFAMYDTNQNFKLEPTELGALCGSLGKELTADEAKEAVRLLDSNSTGFIEFNEFVAWWCKKVKLGNGGSA